MNHPKSPLAMIAYFILGLIVIAVAVKVIWWVVSLAIGLITLAIVVAVVVAVGYLTYLLLRAAIKSSQ
jgi:c-di-AMP phosphodiesterase-like protein